SDRRRQAAIDAKVKSFLSHPVTWQVHSDRRRVIGHMLLTKDLDDRGNVLDLGVKVIGGRMTLSGRLGAFITKVKPGSVADRVGKLRPDDEVLEWNNRSLKGLTFEEVVFAILVECKSDRQIELVVQRPLDDGTQEMEAKYLQQQQQQHLHQLPPDDLMGLPATPRSRPLTNSRIPTMRITRTASQDMAGAASPIPRFSSAGRIQLQLWFDPLVCQLTCCLMSAFGLAPSAPDGAPPSAFAVLGLVPEIEPRSRAMIGFDPTGRTLSPTSDFGGVNSRKRQLPILPQQHLVGGGVSRGGYGRSSSYSLDRSASPAASNASPAGRVIEDNEFQADQPQPRYPYAYQQHPQYQQQQQHRRRPGAGPDFEEGGGSDVSENSDAASELSKLSVVSTQSERPRMMRGGAAAAHAAAASATASRSSAMSAAAGATGRKISAHGDAAAASSASASGRSRRSSSGHRFSTLFPSLGRKSNSTNNLQ
uniref:PDZ domain-containing protein n=1 Tax=Macrostomum lignano TaxID=282301 RepID=A0A1I8F9Q7_9PLAT